jgi:hypothetical protein
MSKGKSPACAGFAALSFALLASQAGAQTHAAFAISSPDIVDGANLDKRFAGPEACGGGNVSPALNWTNAPQATRSFAVVTLDFEARYGDGAVHWVAYGIDPNASGLPQGAGAAGSKLVVLGKGTNVVGYRGPCAPANDPHHYIYTVYALDLPTTALAGGLTRDAFLGRIKGHVLALTSIVTRYAKPR